MLLLAACGGSGGGDGGGGAASVSPPSGLSYPSPQTAAVNAAVSLAPTVTGTVSSYGVAPALPAGLALNASSGVISGAPTAIAAQATYTITAANSAGNTTFGLVLTVTPAAPTDLSYTSPAEATVGVAMTPLAPTVTGDVAEYAVAPALPAGLSLEPTTGVISGTPTEPAAEATYTITASNEGGDASFDLSLTVHPSATATGVFRDTIVEGLAYVSGAQSGVTNAKGEFTYEVGQSVTFAVGAVVLGTTPQGKPLVTPVDLRPGSDSGSLDVINVARFLLMLDDDGDTSNGIRISDGVRAAAEEWAQVDFASADFEDDLAPVIADARAADGGPHELPSILDAQEHLVGSVLCAHSGGFVGPFTDPDSGRQGRFMAAILPFGELELRSYTDSPTAQDGLYAFALTGVDWSLSGDVSLEQPHVRLEGAYADPDHIAGTWEMSGAAGVGAGEFSMTRVGGASDARHRFTGTLVDVNEDDPTGLVVLDVDAADNVTGVLYELSTGRQVPITGALSGETFTGAVDGAAMEGTLIVEPYSMFLDGAFVSGGRTFEFFTQGCSLNYLLPEAEVLIDTGEPGGATLSSIAGAHAAQVTFDAVTDITSFETFVRVSVAGSATVALYADEAGSPGQMLYSEAIDLTFSDAPTWQGARELRWGVTPGTYWISLEVRDGQTAEGQQRIGIDAATLPPNPVAAEAGVLPGETEWTPRGGRRGWRVSGRQ